MIEIWIMWKKETKPLKIALFRFGNEKTRAVIEALNELSEYPIDLDDLLDSWPLGDQEEIKADG